MKYIKKFRIFENEEVNFKEQDLKVLTIGDWYDVSNFDTKKGGISDAQDKRYGLILGFRKNGEEQMITLAPQIVDRDGQKFIYEPKVYNLRLKDLLRVTKDGIEIKYDSEKVNNNLDKLKNSQFNKDRFKSSIDKNIYIKDQGNGGYYLDLYYLGKSSGGIQLDVSTLDQLQNK
jgi:hypothetical protein